MQERDLSIFTKLLDEAPEKLSDEDLVWAIKQFSGLYTVTEQKHFEAELAYRNMKATNRYSRIIIALTVVIAILTGVMLIKMFIGIG